MDLCGEGQDAEALGGEGVDVVVDVLAGLVGEGLGGFS